MARYLKFLISSPFKNDLCYLQDIIIEKWYKTV